MPDVDREAFGERAAALTARQRECLRLLGELKDPQQIADELGISLRTVEGHLSGARTVLRANSSREAARLLRTFEEQIGAYKIREKFSRIEEPASDPPSPEAQSDGELAGDASGGLRVREMPKAYATLSDPYQSQSWSPLPGSERRPSGLPPLRRFVLIVMLVIGLGAGVGIAVLTVAGAIVTIDRSRP